MKLQAIKSWLLEEKSTVTSEKGMYLMLGIGLVIGVGILLFTPIKEGFNDVMQRFRASTGGNFNTDDLDLNGTDWNYTD